MKYSICTIQNSTARETGKERTAKIELNSTLEFHSTVVSGEIMEILCDALPFRQFIRYSAGYSKFEKLSGK